MAPSIKLSSGALMPIVGFGTWEDPPSLQFENSLHTALRLGYRNINTAWSYANEKIIGVVLRQWFFKKKLRRNDIFITTRVPIIGARPGYIEKFLDKSLRKLKLTYVDLYLLPFPIRCDFVGIPENCRRPEFKVDKTNENYIDLHSLTNYKALWQEMEALVRKGKAKSIGLAFYSIEQIKIILRSAKIKPAVLLEEINIFLQRNELVAFCNKNNIKLIAYSPLGNQGYNRLLYMMYKCERVEDFLEDETVKEIAEKYKKTTAQVALKFLIQKGYAVIPKCVTPPRIRECLEVFKFNINREDMETLLTLDHGPRGNLCMLHKKVEKQQSEQKVEEKVVEHVEIEVQTEKPKWYIDYDNLSPAVLECMAQCTEFSIDIDVPERKRRY